MPKTDQGVNMQRYHVIPRTLVFITREDSVLLIKGAPTKKIWANRYNGLGGHVERGESVVGAARRELFEETGITVDPLILVGTLLVDASERAGICLFIYKGVYSGGEIVHSAEGQAEWINLDSLDEIPLVDDLRVLLPRVLEVSSGAGPFSARSFYDEDEKLRVVFDE